MTGLFSISRKQFDKDFDALIKKLTDKYLISEGHSQKILSILIKYAFVVYNAQAIVLPQSWRDFIEGNINQLPAPIDAIVLKKLKSDFSNLFSDVYCFTFKPNAGRSGSSSVKIKSKQGHVSWSRLRDIDVYWSVQKRVRQLAAGKGINPLEYEMTYLWN